jgi:hypothetical protein
MTGVVVDQRVFKYFLDIKAPLLSTHLEKLQIDISPIVLRWFMCLYANVFALPVQ